MEIRHTSQKTKGLECDGQPCFEVLVRKTRRSESERYWCGQLHGYFDPRDVDCPREAERPERRGPGFNRGLRKL